MHSNEKTGYVFSHKYYEVIQLTPPLKQRAPHIQSTRNKALILFAKINAAKILYIASCGLYLHNTPDHKENQ